MAVLVLGQPPRRGRPPARMRTIAALALEDESVLNSPKRLSESLCISYSLAKRSLHRYRKYAGGWGTKLCPTCLIPMISPDEEYVCPHCGFAAPVLVEAPGRFTMDHSTGLGSEPQEKRWQQPSFDKVRTKLERLASRLGGFDSEQVNQAYKLYKQASKVKATRKVDAAIAASLYLVSRETRTTYEFEALVNPKDFRKSIWHIRRCVAGISTGTPAAAAARKLVLAITSNEVKAMEAAEVAAEIKKYLEGHRAPVIAALAAKMVYPGLPYRDIIARAGTTYASLARARKALLESLPPENDLYEKVPSQYDKQP